MKQVFPLLLLLLIYSCGDSTEKSGLTVVYTDMEGNVLSSVTDENKLIEVAIERLESLVFTVEQWEKDRSKHNFLVKGNLLSKRKQTNRLAYIVSSHLSDSIEKVTLFGINEKTNTIDSIYIEFGGLSALIEQRQIMKLYGNLQLVTEE